MSAQVDKLQALLARVQERAREPRSAPVVSSLSAVSTPEMQLDEPDLDLSPSDEAQPVDEPQLMAEPQAMDEPQAFSESPSLGESQDLDEEDVIVDEFDDVSDLDDIEEIDVDELPQSGQISAESMDRAMSDAEHQPPLTPPPESGEGVTSPQIPHHSGPTMEQLGETISLEEGSAQDFELDAPDFDEEVGSGQTSGELEADLPDSLAPADEGLSVPEDARQELDRVRLGDSTPIEARVSVRPVLSTNVVDLVQSSRTFQPKTFSELLDASLSLK